MARAARSTRTRLFVYPLLAVCVLAVAVLWLYLLYSQSCHLARPLRQQGWAMYGPSGVARC